MQWENSEVMVLYMHPLLSNVDDKLCNEFVWETILSHILVHSGLSDVTKEFCNENHLKNCPIYKKTFTCRRL